MPFYEYKCDSCGHQFEVMQRINDDPLTECEACGAEVRRIIFPSAIVYKGSGFYSTEYGRSRFNAPNGGGPSSEGEGKGDSATKSDSSSSTDGPKDGGSTSTNDKAGPKKAASGEAAA